MNKESGTQKSHSSLSKRAVNGRIKFAVLGCGHIGKRHAVLIQQNNDCELAALIDVRPQSSLQIEVFGVPFYDRLESYLDINPDVDVIIIATPNGLHAAQAIQCLEARKHVIVEKPVALTKEDVEKVIATSIRVQKHVFTVMQNRYSPPGVWLKELLENNRLGKIYLVQINCYWNRDERYYKQGDWHGDQQLDGGTLFTQFSHFIDMMYWCFGDISNIQARFADFNHADLTDFEDTGIVNFDFVNGGIGSFNYSTSVWDKNLESSITVIAQNGSLKITGQYMDEVAYCHIKNYEMPQLPSGKNNKTNHLSLIQNVIDTLRKERIATNPVHDGLNVVNIIERIYQSK